MAILESKDPDGAKKGQYSGPRNRRASQMLHLHSVLPQNTSHSSHLPDHILHVGLGICT